MLQRVSSNCLQRATQASINTLQICDAKFQVSHLCVDMKVDGDFDRLGFNPASLSNKIQILASIAVKAIQASIVDIENICQGVFWLWQVLFAMVKAWRKAKRSKLLEQIAY